MDSQTEKEKIAIMAENMNTSGSFKDEKFRNASGCKRKLPGEPIISGNIRPTNLNQRIRNSTLSKGWYRFVKYANRFVLHGSFSNTHKKFQTRSNGKQGACNCIVACVISSLVETEVWSENTVNEILLTGNTLFERSIKISKHKMNGSPISIERVNSTFFFGKHFIKYEVIHPDEFNFTLCRLGEKQELCLAHILRRFFHKYRNGALSFGYHYIAIWVHNNAYYLFDPSEHKKNGEKWNGLSGMGYAICIRFLQVQNLADYIEADINESTCKMKIWVIALLKCEVQNLQVPTIEKLYFFGEERDMQPSKKLMEEKRMKSEKSQTEFMKTCLYPDFARKNDESGEIPIRAEACQSDSILDLFIRHPPELIPKLSEFSLLIKYGFMGIIQGSTHQKDSKFSRFHNGEQSLSQAVAALIMRQSLDTSRWNPEVIDDILVLGETLHHNSLKENPLNPVKFSSILKDVVYPPNHYFLDFQENFIFGNITTDDTHIPDLLQALRKFFKNSNACIIIGPLIVAVWKDNDNYYMYDPNDRDSEGRNLDIYNNEKSENIGFACVTYFTRLFDLFCLYTENISKLNKRDHFELCKVSIRNSYSNLENWNNFKGLAVDKWILKGTINQNSLMFQDESRNYHNTPIAAMALAYNIFKPVEQWTSDNVDRILRAGNEYYKTITKDFQQKGQQLRMLMVNELDRFFYIDKKKISFDIEEYIINGIVKCTGDVDNLNIKTGLIRFFKNNDYGIFSTIGMALAIWRLNDSYFLFNPLPYHNAAMKAGNTFSSDYGAACILKTLQIIDFAKFIENCIISDNTNIFSISALNVEIENSIENEVISKIPLNNFSENVDNDNIAILLANISNEDPKYESNGGKQSLPMCITAIAVNKMRPCLLWTSDILAMILDEGERYFEECLAYYDASGEGAEEKKISSNTVRKEFSIGEFNFKVYLETVAEGTGESEFRTILTEYYTNDHKHFNDILVELDEYTLAVWEDSNIYYVFDPHPCDTDGKALEKNIWSSEDLDAPDSAPTVERNIKIDAVTQNQLDEKSDNDSVKILFRDEISLKDNDSTGKACILLFYNLDDLIQHIVDNIRPSKQDAMPFKLCTAVVLNRSIPNRESDHNYKGTWKNFNEIEYGIWILRGNMDLTNEVFPEENRGKQEYACVYAALAFAKAYTISSMKSQHISSILCYGDRLLTFVKRLRKEDSEDNMKSNTSKSETAITQNKNFLIHNFPNDFVIQNTKVHITFIENFIIGILNSKIIGNSVDLRKGLNNFLTSNTFGILECEGYMVGIWKGIKLFYMFDPHNIGSQGLKSTVGYPALTRFLKTEQMAYIFQQNANKHDDDLFYIHKVIINEKAYKRSKDLMQKTFNKSSKIMLGFQKMCIGKFIIKGTKSQNHPKFGKKGNMLNLSTAVIALTMSLIHKPETWSETTVDEVLENGYTLYRETIDKLAPLCADIENFINPYMILNDYRVGSLRANCQVKNSDIRGVFESEQSGLLGLRQALELFFIEYNHGIIYSAPNICYSIWEEKYSGYPMFYLFDPNSRTLHYPYTPNGFACLLAFGSTKIAAEHINNCILRPEEEHEEFTIIPVDIIIGPFKTSNKQLKTELNAQANDHFPRKIQLDGTLLNDKPQIKKKAMEQKQKEKIMKKYWETRTEYCELTKRQAVLRGTRSINCTCYTTNGLQVITTCIAAFVASCIMPINRWSYKDIDEVLDAGVQLYKDSYLAYSPRDLRIGLRSIVRTVFIMGMQANVIIYKPVKMYGFDFHPLIKNFEKWFAEYDFCLFNYQEQWVAIFFKQNNYYIFDPYGRSESGSRAVKHGNACVVKIEMKNDLAMKILNDLKQSDLAAQETMNHFYEFVLLKLERGVCNC